MLVVGEAECVGAEFADDVHVGLVVGQCQCVAFAEEVLVATDAA